MSASANHYLEDDDTERFLRIRREICDKLLGWNSALLWNPAMSQTLSGSFRQLAEQDFSEFTICATGS